MSEPSKRVPLALPVAIFTPPTGSIRIFTPSLPGLQPAFATDYAKVQLTLSLYLVGLLLTDSPAPLVLIMGAGFVLAWPFYMDGVRAFAPKAA